MVQTRSSRALLVLAVVGLVVLATVPAGVLAHSGTQPAQTGGQAGGTIVVGPGETVDELTAFGGTVVVEGTVTGDVNAVSGTIVIEEGGTVGGDISGVAGSIEIHGQVDGSVAVAGGVLEVGETGTVAGSIEAGVGTATIHGVIDGDVTIGADTITLGETAAIAGDLRYDGSLEGDRNTVAGEITRDSTLGVDLAPVIQPLAAWVFAMYAFAANLILGALLLLLFPRFSADVATRVATEPLRTGAIGLIVLGGVPLLLLGLLFTIVGIPLSILGAVLFALLVWVGVVYGRFAVAAWALSSVGVTNRWIALVVGLVAGAILGLIPIFGWFVNLVITLLGLGALASGLVAQRRDVGDTPPTAEQPSDGGGDPGIGAAETHGGSASPSSES
ncbi:polymer-forming cytoskeletal protein [Halobacteria archaeon AArc-curdl1]|uniref:Polymer-forming cytoskeletal protein n=1 Tax=Natronosalvus hydrolyticus TaxID=2979988 RepID=A0AAP2Z805_9EURY|nr:polymer-forming cytoskeletal protein [Halobacteria archaeon AArc-curdl1]